MLTLAADTHMERRHGSAHFILSRPAALSRPCNNTVITGVAECTQTPLFPKCLYMRGAARTIKGSARRPAKGRAAQPESYAACVCVRARVSLTVQCSLQHCRGVVLAPGPRPRPRVTLAVPRPPPIHSLLSFSFFFAALDFTSNFYLQAA